MEECGSIFNKLHQLDAKRYQHDFARSLDYQGWHLQRARYFGLAESIVKEAVILRRQLYNAAPESSRLRADLAHSLNNYASALRNLGKPDDAQIAEREAAALRRKNFLTAANLHSTELGIFARDMGEFVFEPDS